MTTTKLGRPEAVHELTELSGLWKRTLLIDSTGHRDEASDVSWLQACSAFVDVRQPVDRPLFADVNGGRALNARQRGWIHSQQGFAGTLVVSGGIYEWRRAIDLHPPPATPDACHLVFDGDVLVETGHRRDYVERWLRAGPAAQPEWAMHLQGHDGRTALLARVGNAFGWARGRPYQMTAHDHFLDCEYAIGLVEGSVWRITTSTLPFREGADLGPRLAAGGVTSADVTENGRGIRAQWAVRATEGTVRL
ncbi:MAG: hypothetical protein M3N95_15090 [Actinomycetota bacterium]|nr:hypothetical protein [Actinomycetota bacterium]